MAIPFALGTFSVAGCSPFAGVVIEDRVTAVSAVRALSEKLAGSLSMPETVFGLLQAWDRNFPVLQAAIDELKRADKQSGEGVELSRVGISGGRVGRGTAGGKSPRLSRHKGPPPATPPPSPLRTSEETSQKNLPVGEGVESVALDAVKTHAPVLYPRQVFCAGANYRQHVIDLAVAQGHGAQDTMSLEERRAEAARVMDERIASGSPYVFTKIPSAITGPYDPVILPADTREADWELELAVIIGRAARHVPRTEALTYVAGYTIVNDLTSRDKVYRADMKAIGTDWLASKSSPSFLPMGPYLVPAAFVADPQQLHLTLKLNGQVMQDEGTDDMIFGVARLIEYISGLVQLWPGDLICTGSPRGNGMHYNRFLRPGDVLEGAITGLGSQRNTCVAEKA